MHIISLGCGGYRPHRPAVRLLLAARGVLGDGAAPLERVAELAAQLGDGARGVGGEAAAEPEGDLAEREEGRQRQR